jgi:hypothetical protein
MYELTQIASHPEFARRVYPIVMPDAAMREVGQEHLEGVRDELDLYEDIRNTIGRIMSVLRDMNTLTPEMHHGTDFEQLYSQLAAALQV